MSPTTVGGFARVALAALLLSACAPRLQLGSEILWSAHHETGDLSEWLQGGKGGSVVDAPDTSVAVSTDFAHGGLYSAKLTNNAASTLETASLWRQDTYPTDAYYSAWYYLPRTYQTTNDWIVMQIRAPVVGDPTTISLLLDLDLRSLPGGELLLTVFDHRPAYLRSPTPDPAVLVPVGSWFQIETFYRNVGDQTGRVVIWLDGQVAYDLHRPFGQNSAVYFTACSVGDDLSPTDSVLYIDDAAVSLAQIGPIGAF
jgi:hypothetical protein